MTDKTVPTDTTANGLESGATDRFAKVFPARRRLMTGLAAAPVLASMEIRNAMATGTQCTTPSGNMSGNVSHTAGIGSCTGKPPSYCAANWVGQNPKFHSKYQKGSNCDFGSTTPTPTLKSACGYSGALDPNHIACYFACAYQNVMAGRVQIPGFDQTQLVGMLQGIWDQWVTTGAYQVNATTSWSGSQIKTYLTSNGIVGT